MKIKTKYPQTTLAKGTDAAGAVALIVAMALVIAAAGLAFWWLIPIATGGAVAMTFGQGVALAAVLHIGRVLLTPQK